MLARCRKLGFDLYQGYFFCRPQLVCAQPVQADRMAVMRLIARLQDPKTDFEELEQAVSCNPVLAYQLLKYINSAHCGMRGQITSIRQALLLVGLNMIRSWATLLLMSRMANDKPEELIAMALIRARMCELLGRRDRSHGGDQYFTVGLLSVLDALLDRPLAEAIAGLPLAQEVHDALACRSGPLGQTLDVVLHYERGRSDRQLAAGAAYATPAYVQAVAWSLEATQALPKAG
jgi:c-di-GMP phosphodiesterase